MPKNTYCDYCKCEQNCKVFFIQKRNSEAFDDIKKFLNLEKNQFAICEKHYPRDAVTESVLKGKKDKLLDKDAKNHMPTENLPTADQPNQILEPIITNEVAEKPTKHLNRNKTLKLVSKRMSKSFADRVRPREVPKEAEISILAISAHEGETNISENMSEGDIEKRARFESYKGVELRKNWSIEDENDDHIIFMNCEIDVQITVTNDFKFTIQEAREKIGFQNESITKEQLQNILRNVESGAWKDDTE